MARIHILGAPGSGKTTCAKYLASQFFLPHYELDQITRKNAYQVDANINDAALIAEAPAWITEGVYLIWTDLLLYNADYIIFLDIFWYVAIYRIIYRHLVKSLCGNNPYPSMKSLFLLLHFTYCYCLNKRTETIGIAEAFLEEQGTNVTVPDVNYLIRCFRKYKNDIPPTARFTRKYLQKYKNKVFLIKNTKDWQHFLTILRNAHRGLQ